MARILIDGNSLLNAALLGGIDKDEGRVIVDDEGKKTQVNSAQYGVDKFFERIAEICTEFDAAPRDMVVTWDGANSKARRMASLPTYKQGRSKAPEVSEQLNIARDTCTKSMLALGAHVVQQPGFEADDVLGYLCKTMRGERNVVVTSDGDLTVLHDENTDVWRLGQLNENPYGRFPHKYITLYKSLVGDTSDKIPGAKGFGDASWVDLVRVFGFDGLELLEELIVKGRLKELAEDVPSLKSLQKIIDNAEMVATSWHVASLHVEEINTVRRPLEVRAGMVTQWGDQAVFQAPELRRFYGTKTLVTAANYDAVKERFARVVGQSPFVALDIETSSSEQSDEWMDSLMKALDSDRERFDVLGHELTGMSLTFGDNTQHTIYMSVDHADTDNITVDQCREMCELIPSAKMHTVIQNRQFEFSVLYRTWGDKWANNGWSGFVPNAVDTKVGASYCDENIKKGLKQRSLHHLGYTQTSYEQTTTKSGPVGSFKCGQHVKSFDQETVPAVYKDVVIPVEDEWIDDDGEIHKSLTEQVTQEMVTPAVTEPWETRSFKMRELTAKEVVDYGCDDTICTAALHTHYKFVMDLENTWQVYLEVETLPEYLTSLAYVQGIPISLPTLKAMERRDDQAYDDAWKTLREFLMKKGWDGTECPEFADSIEPADAKLAVAVLLDGEFATRKRKLNGIALDIREQFPDNERAELLASIVESNDVPALNKLVKTHFTGEPKINFGSPKQMQELFYEVIGIKPRILNKMTDNQRENPVMASAFQKVRTAKKYKIDMFETGAGLEVAPEEGGRPSRHMTLVLTDEERKALISKASTDDTAVDTALAMDKLTDDAKAVLVAYKTIKEVQTRRNLFYKTYKAIPHWRDGRIHPSLNQSEAVTRRYSSSGPNIQQLPKKGNVPFRKVLQPHAPNAVVCSLDYKSQELRLSAEHTKDAAMTACFVGDHLMDIHSLTAVSAAPLIWHEEVAYEDFLRMLESKDPAVKARAKALRSQAKTTVFASAYGAMAGKIAETLLVSEDVAQAFLDAKDAAFPRVRQWDAEVTEKAKETGYSVTMLGARRHLREALANPNSYERSKAERQVGNFAIQSSGSEVNKLAMARMWQRGLFTGKYRAQFFAPIHDENVFSVHRDDAFGLIKEVHECMTAQYANMKIPMESSISLGPDFGEQIEVGDFPDKVVIEAAITSALGDAK